MLVYKRNNWKVYLLRLTGLILICASIYFFSADKNDYAAVIIFFFFMGSVFPVASLSVMKDSFKVSRFLFYGFLPKVLHVDSGCEVHIRPVSVEMLQSHAAPDSMWDLLFSFVPAQKATVQKFRITKVDPYGSKEAIELTLNSEELRLLNSGITKR